MNGWIGQWMDRLVDGWMDGRIGECMDWWMKTSKRARDRECVEDGSGGGWIVLQAL